MALEDLTPDELMIIAYLMTLCVGMYSISTIVRALIDRNKFKSIEVAISHKCGGVKKKPLLIKWVEERKKRKEEKRGDIY